MVSRSLTEQPSRASGGARLAGHVCLSLSVCCLTNTPTAPTTAFQNTAPVAELPPPHLPSPHLHPGQQWWLPPAPRPRIARRLAVMEKDKPVCDWTGPSPAAHPTLVPAG
jgi:hypothetical protein